MSKRKKKKFNSNGCGDVCYYCQRTLVASTKDSNLSATKDHLHPKSMGGTLRVWSCRKCNSLKGNMTFSEWRSYMADNPDWYK